MQKKVIENSLPAVTTQYAGNYVYKGVADATPYLEFFNHPEGYVEPDEIEEGYSYVYQYKDHLGNVRLSYTENEGDTEIVEENNYYPFGLKHKGYNNVVNGTEHKYKTFQGQEINEELGLNWLSFKWRNYDPSLARFHNIDPLAEQYNYQSPYNFSENRVIDGVELEGLEWMDYKVAMWEAQKAQVKALDNGASHSQSRQVYKQTYNANVPFGNMSDQAVGTAGEVGAGFVPVLAQIIDAKDTYNAFFNGGDGWDKAFALAAWIPGLDFLKSGRKVLKGATKVDAAAINKTFGQAPYDEAFDVIEGFTKQGETFVRVHGGSNKVSKWMMKASEIEGLSPQQIQDKFALPELPTHISNVNVPAGTNVRVGVAGKVNGWGNGGGQQVELLQRLSEDAFTNTRKLE